MGKHDTVLAFMKLTIQWKRNYSSLKQVWWGNKKIQSELTLGTLRYSRAVRRGFPEGCLWKTNWTLCNLKWTDGGGFLGKECPGEDFSICKKFHSERE